MFNYSYANSYGNLGTYGRSGISVGLGKVRPSPGSITRVFNYCAGGTADLDLVLNCTFGNSPKSIAASKNNNPTIDPNVGLYTTIIFNNVNGTDGAIDVRNNVSGKSILHTFSNTKLYQVQSSDSGQYIYVTVQPTAQSITPQTVCYYVSDNYGVSFKSVGPSVFKNNKVYGIQSFAVSGNGQTLIASITADNGNSEAYSYLYVSTDAGSTWNLNQTAQNDYLFVQVCINKAGSIILALYDLYKHPNVGDASFTSYVYCSNGNFSNLTEIAQMTSSNDTIKNTKAIYFSSIQLEETAFISPGNNIGQGNVTIGIGQFGPGTTPSLGEIKTLSQKYTIKPNTGSSMILNGKLQGTGTSPYLSLPQLQNKNLSSLPYTINTIQFDALEKTGIAINGFVYNNGTYSSVGGSNAYGVWDAEAGGYQALQQGYAYLNSTITNGWQQISLINNNINISNNYWLSATISKDGKQIGLVGCDSVTNTTPNTPAGNFYVCLSTNFGSTWTIYQESYQPVGIYIN
jgi:hypothetical protein